MPLRHLVLLIIVAASILLMLVRPRGLREAWWVGGGASLLLLLGLIPLRLAFRAVAQGTDVYLFLIGMMLLSELARQQGVFDWLAAFAVARAAGSRVRLFTLTYLAGTLVTIFLSNDATAVVLTPAILVAVRRARVPPLPYLFACALIANAASFVLPISNPANLVVFRGAMPPLTQWLFSFALPSALSITITYTVLRWIFRRELRVPLLHPAGHPSPALSSSGKLVLAGIAAMVVVLLTASAYDRDLGLPTCLAALAITALVSTRTRSNPLPLAREISWPTIALVAALFILVNALESIGALRITTHWLFAAQGLPTAAGALLAASSVAIANNLINNLPLGLIAGSTLHAAHASRLMADVVLIGVDLGPNLSITGSLATILWLLALRKEGVNVSFWRFLQVGLVAMPAALLPAVASSLVLYRLQH